METLIPINTILAAIVVIFIIFYSLYDNEK